MLLKRGTGSGEREQKNETWEQNKKIENEVTDRARF